MRRVNKQPPPRDAARPGQPPRPWLAFEGDLRDRLREGEVSSDAARAAFDATDFHKTADALLREQRGLCVFCERPLRRDEGTGAPVAEAELPPGDGRRPHATRRAHWTPLRRDPSRALDWHNLYASSAGSCAATTCPTSRPERRGRADPRAAALARHPRLTFTHTRRPSNTTPISCTTDAPACRSAAA